MSLATCRDCGRKVSTAAVSCPQCGRVFTSAVPQAPQQTAAGKQFILVLVLGGIALVAFARACSTDIPGDPAAATQAEQSRQDAELQYEGQEAVKANLRDPGSAKFSDVVVVRKSGSIAVCGAVNAKNGFGGYSGASRFMARGDLAVVESPDNVAEFSKLWNKACVQH